MRLYFWTDPVQVFLVPTVVLVTTPGAFGIAIRFWHLALSFEPKANQGDENAK
jgi:hypothetical protein